MLLLGGVRVIAKSSLLGVKGINIREADLKNKIVPLYISMSSKPSKQNTNTIKTDAATKIQKLYKANKQTLNKEHAI